VLPTAGRLPAGKLRATAERLAIALDPDWAEHRYREAVRHQRVICVITGEGTVTLAGHDLPAEEALAAKAHVWALAKAAKRAGAHASADRLRATLFTGLQTPRFLGMSQLEIIADLVQQFPKPTIDDPTENDPIAEPTAAEPKAEPAASPEPETEPTAGPTAEPTVAEPATGSAQPTAKPQPAAQPTRQPQPVIASGVELRVGLASLMGLSDAPGEVAGAGPVIAPLARDIAQTQRRGQWRFVIVDEQGQLLHAGITRHRPAGYPAGGDKGGGAKGGGAKGGIVEVHVPTYLLDPALLEEHPAWARLLTDLAQQYATQAPITQDPAARAPGQPLRRRIQLTHRYCLFPTCRRPAADSQTDHRHQYAHGGATLEPNPGPLCERHHDLKTRWGWRLIKRNHHTYLWISPLGRRHLITIEPVAPPLPDPPDTTAA